MADLTLRGSFDSTDERKYVYVPFEVPPGVRALHITYDYSDRIPSDPNLRGGNTLDIGLFDPQGIGASGAGFRGWSGSSKRQFTIAESWATPPYTAGRVQPGTWQVLLGPYKVAPAGCDYEVAISFADDPGEPEEHPMRVELKPPALAPAAEPGWLRGDLHCHTLYSDGDSWPAEPLADAVRRRLDFLGVTDHNTTAHHTDFARVNGEHLPIVLPGIEVTTYAGHWNAWGTHTWWEFREPTEAAVSRAMLHAAASGALVSVNHPKPFGPPWEYPNAIGYHAIEVWNGSWQHRNHVSLAWWDEQLRAGRRMVALGGSDTHVLKRENTHRLGSPTTWANVGDDQSSEAVIAALRAGRAFISRDVVGPQLYLSIQADGFGVRAVDAGGAMLVLVSQHGVELTRRVNGADWAETFRPSDMRYARAPRVDDQAGMLALSNACLAP